MKTANISPNRLLSWQSKGKKMKIFAKKKKDNCREIYFLNFMIYRYSKKYKTKTQYDGLRYVQYCRFLRLLHYFMKPKIYVEVGVAFGNSLIMADKSTKVIGIDPVNRLKYPLAENCQIFFETSDDFFARHNIVKEFHAPVDLAFLDGMHLFEYYLRDFINLEKNSHKDTVIVIHDTTPVDEVSSMRERKQDFWTGDVFKMVLILKKYRPDLKIINIDECYTGICCVTNCNPESTILKDNYDKIVEEFMLLSFADIKENRNEILSIEHSFDAFLKLLEQI